MIRSFIDTTPPITPGENFARDACVALPLSIACSEAMFRRAKCGSDVQNNLLQFVGDTGFFNEDLLTSLETALTALEKEREELLCVSHSIRDV